MVLLAWRPGAEGKRESWSEGPAPALRERARLRRRWFVAADEKGDSPYRRTRAATPLARAAILWRRLRRFRLGGFEPERCDGRLERKAPPLAPLPRAGLRRRGSRQGGVPLDIEQAVALSEAVASPHGRQALPASEAELLLRSLGDYCVRLLARRGEGAPGGGADGGEAAAASDRRALGALRRVAAGLATCGVRGGELLAALESHLAAPGPHRPQSLARALVAYEALACLEPGGRTTAAAAVRPLLRYLLQSEEQGGQCPGGGSSNRAARLWALPPEDVTAVAAAVAGLVADAGALDGESRCALRAGLLRLLAPGAAVMAPGSAPPSAEALAGLAAAALWLEPAVPSQERDVAFHARIHLKVRLRGVHA